MDRVAVVVLTYNGLPWVEQALESVRGYETVVVDHGSTDGTLELVRERFPEVRVVEQANVGFAGGNNRGLRETDAPLVCLLNSDAWFVDDGLERLAAYAEAHPEAALATGFLFFLVNVALAVPGALILGWESIRGHGWIASRSSS